MHCKKKRNQEEIHPFWPQFQPTHINWPLQPHENSPPAGKTIRSRIPLTVLIFNFFFFFTAVSLLLLGRIRRDITAATKKSRTVNQACVELWLPHCLNLCR